MENCQFAESLQMPFIHSYQQGVEGIVRGFKGGLLSHSCTEQSNKPSLSIYNNNQLILLNSQTTYLICLQLVQTHTADNC